jgi:putative membrane protein
MKTTWLLAMSCLFFSHGISFASVKSAEDFLTDAMKGDNSEIKLGLLAQARGGSKDVREFGRMLVEDHRHAKIAAADAASALGVTPTDDPTTEALAEATKLNRMSGARFDGEFVHYMIADHRKDISKFEAEVKSSNKARTLAAQQLPTLEKHLRFALSLKEHERTSP